MADQYDNTNTGAAFKKDGYSGFSGVLNVGGVEYFVSLYDQKKDGTPNIDKKGNPWMRITVKKIEPKQEDEVGF